MTTEGLPELPKGQFWRVSRHSSRYLYLELRRKYLIGSGHIKGTEVSMWGWTEDCAGTRDYTQDELRELIREAAEEMLRERAEKDILNSSLNELTGDYPPKRLEA